LVRPAAASFEELAPGIDQRSDRYADSNERSTRSTLSSRQARSGAAHQLPGLSGLECLPDRSGDIPGVEIPLDGGDASVESRSDCPEWEPVGELKVVAQPIGVPVSFEHEPLDCDCAREIAQPGQLSSVALAELVRRERSVVHPFFGSVEPQVIPGDHPEHVTGDLLDRPRTTRRSTPLGLADRLGLRSERGDAAVEQRDHLRRAHALTVGATVGPVILRTNARPACQTRRQQPRRGTMAGTVRLELDGPIATITNDNVEKHNAFDDEMDAQLFGIFDELAARSETRAIIWRGEGKSWSSGRDVGSIGTNKTELTHHELMARGHRGIQKIWEIEAPIIVPIQGWAIGGSFQRALMCDIRIATPGSKFMLPEVGHGVIPDTGGVAVLHEMCGPGLVSDMVLTGRRLTADEALGHGIVSRVVPEDELDSTAREMAEKIAAAPAVTVKMARRVIAHLSRPTVRASMDDELIYQTFLNKSDDFAEFKAARAEEREPNYRGS
jgi:enoyl-CoA hydratase/carnithine racemase